jgi:hypothetical protein
MARQRVPPDRLPALGDWDGPIYGELGVLAVGGDLVQCHACGRNFSLLAYHAIRTHGAAPDVPRRVRRRGGEP